MTLVPAGARMVDVPRVVVEHFGYGTLRNVLYMEANHERDLPPALKVLGEGWARAMVGDDPITLPYFALNELYTYANAVWGYYGNPYKVRVARKSGCDLCLSTAYLLNYVRQEPGSQPLWFAAYRYWRGFSRL